MQMLSDESMQVTLARTRMVNTVNERARDELLGLRMRLNALQQAGVFVIPQALSPSHLADGLLQTRSDLQVPLRTQAQIIEGYCAHGAEPLCRVYRGANQLLIEQGILPDYLVTNLKNSNYSRFGDGTRNQYELEQKFIQLQEALCELSLNDWRPGLLRHLLDTPPRYAATEAQQQVFDRVETSFVAMKSDKKISDRIRAEIHRLALPVLTVLLTTPDQIASTNSPMHLFVRQLAMLGHRDKESPLHEFENIKIVVSRVVSEHGREMTSFHVGSGVLFTLSKNEIKRRMTGGDPLAITQSGGIKVENADDAKQRVTAELRNIIKGLTVPPAIMQIVLKLMAPWMMIRLQRYGENSIAWTEAKTWTAAFFDLMRPAGNQEECSALHVGRRFALQQIRVRTQRSSLSPPEADAWLNDLEQYFNELDQADESRLSDSSDTTTQ